MKITTIVFTCQGCAWLVETIGMTSRIHFDDNIYILQSQIQTLRHSLVLDIDPQYFLDKVIEDFFFIDSTLLQLYKALEANEYLVKRTEYLRLLFHCKQEFLSLAQGIVQGQYKFSSYCKPYTGKILLSIQRQENEHEAIRQIVLEKEEPEKIETGLSSAEYEFLLGAAPTSEV